MLVVRELTGGIYFGDEARRDGDAPTTTARTRVAEIERIARVAFEAAPRRAAQQGHLGRQGEHARDLAPVARDRRPRARRASSRTSSSSTCWSTTPRCSWSRAPADFDVIVTENMFGDILTDEAAMLAGSIGMLPSRRLGRRGRPGLYEPVHGSAPDIAGQGDRQPAGDVPLRRADAAPRARSGRARPTAVESAVDRGARERTAHPGSRRRGRRTADERDADAVLDPMAVVERTRARGAGGAHLEERRVRPLGGRQGARPDARRCTTAPGSSRASAATRPSAARRSSATSDHLDRLDKSAELYYMDLPYTLEKLREATHELIGRNRLRSCYIRPIAFRGYGEMGLFPLERPGRRGRSPSGRGAPTSARRARSNGIRSKVSSWRRIARDASSRRPRPAAST